MTHLRSLKVQPVVETGCALATTAAAAVANCLVETSAVAGFAAAAFLVYNRVSIKKGNFRTVEAGKCYRSAQLNYDKFLEKIDQYGIKSILNLRGPQPGKSWYDGELAAAKETGIAHYDVSLDATKPVTEEEIQQILDILRDAPKPVLIKCKAGADRTGLVVALYRLEIQGCDVKRSRRALSLFTGHFPYFFSPTRAMGISFREYARGRRQMSGLSL